MASAIFLVFLVACGCFLVFAGGAGCERKKYGASVANLIVGLMFIFFVGYAFQKNIRGTPAELKADGIYRVRIVHFWIPEGPGKSDCIGVLVLKEEGKTDPKTPVYRKIPVDFFKAGDQKDLAVGQEMTVELKTFNYQKIEVKQK